MPRSKPAPENEPERTTISLPFYVGKAAARFERLHRELALKGFSDLVARALGEYIEKHHPGLIAEVERELRALYIANPKASLKAAEGGEDDGPSVDELIAGEVARRQKRGGGGDARGGGRRPSDRK